MQPDSTPLLETGVAGLDEILRGGLLPGRLYLLEGHPGSGKTTLALQFLNKCAARGETCMFVTLSEAEDELRISARSHGWELDGIHLLEIIASEDNLRPDARYTMYHPSEVELAETTKEVLAHAQRIKPSVLVFDSLSELRLLAENSLRYRRQILALKQHFTRQRATILLIDDRTSEEKDMHLHSLAHGVITLERTAPDYGVLRRRLQIAKMRGRAFSEGFHDYTIKRGGLEVYPRLVAAEHKAEFHGQSVMSGIESLDALLGGGLAKGTSTLLLGAAGTGKSSVATQYATAAARRGEKAAIYLFDESLATFQKRSHGLGMDVTAMMESGHLEVRRVDPAQLSPGEFAHILRAAAAEPGMNTIVIDSLNGYLNAMPSERYLTLHLHELITFLGGCGVTTIMVMTHHGLVGADTQVPVDASYLADTVLTLRYFEALGTVRKAISVIKKRTGRHEKTIREIRMDGNGVTIGEPLREFQGVLSGNPTYVGNVPLLRPSDN